MTRTEMDRIRPHVVHVTRPVNVHAIAHAVGYPNAKMRELRKVAKGVQQARMELAALNFILWLVHGIVVEE